MSETNPNFLMNAVNKSVQELILKYINEQAIVRNLVVSLHF